MYPEVPEDERLTLEMSPEVLSTVAVSRAPEVSRSSCRVNSEQRSSNLLDCSGKKHMCEVRHIQ